MTPLFKKLNFKDHPAIYLLDAPESFAAEAQEMSAVTAVHRTLSHAKAAGFVMAFATKKEAVDRFAAQIAKSTEGDAVVWMVYPKGSSKKYKCDFHRDNGWDQMGAHGFEPVRMVAVDEDWSALRFRRVEHIQTMTRSSAITEAGQKRIQPEK